MAKNQNYESAENLNEQYGQYASNYSDEALEEKMEKDGHKFGSKLWSYVKFLRYLTTDENSPIDTKWKMAIYGGLGYLILPIDLVPDFIPVAGYSDDLAVIALIVASIMKLARDFKNDPEKAQAFQTIKEKAGL